MPHKYISTVLSRIMLGKLLQATVCCFLHTLLRALAGLCVAWQSVHPVHFPLARSKEDNSSDEAIPSRGWSQNHQERELGGSLQCGTHSSWLWSKLNKLEDDAILISTSPWWDVGIAEPKPDPQSFQKKNSLKCPTTSVILKTVSQTWKIRQGWGERHWGTEG